MSISTCHLMGGLGNCLFQIAAAYAYALQTGKEMILYPETHVPAHNYISLYFNNIFRNIKIELKSPPIQEYMESNFHYTPIPYMNGDVKIHGYFQSYRYFDVYENEIRKLFKIDNNTNEFILQKYGTLLDEHTCAMHIRRGDYVQLNDHHPVQDISYYKECIKYYDRNTIFLVFSDDIEWCKNTFGMNERLIYIEGNRDYQDLYLMSMCKHNIIANSTFSWWGAYLNENENKKICSPKNWFGNSLSHHNTKDLYCKEWIIC